MGHERVVEVLKKLAVEHADALAASKRAAIEHGRHSDWPWNGIVLSAATLGGSWRWEKRVQPIYDAELSWRALLGLTAEERRQRFNKVGGYWRRTSAFLERVYGRLLEEGGPEGSRSTLEEMSGPEILAFWAAFDGVGPKYARNIMMDIHHPSFRRDYFAIDSRIQKLLPVLGYTGPNRYESMEAFLNKLAADTGMEGWDLDRLLYQRHDDLIARIQS
ncbi:hypothetical protein [uncultured Sphingomonas sp.]|uniref:hypothetical protein n=1 Tax=uncultured Sphingomonas sp. TaxID=158754 RepID=UPI0025885B1D|nr:hypothetical protein [uncultured Sphingomonas sp.]